ncbi:hypothetical protein ZIOFF_068811 [Zingiber officinale]|uniref:Uncharacterized protein n=1 Tax=Zingiber officinale TaxID=94328 RepID=A0A8J5C396_ZINOF|nr:hypothetical protein ZIOFF_068811 [Zingiber officinale]
MAASAAVILGPISLRSQRRQGFLDAFAKNLFSDQDPSRGRRKGAIFSVVASAYDGEGGRRSGRGAGRFYFNITGFPFPLGPFINRRTIRTEAVKNSIWLFEQEQALGFSSVSTNIRMTVIKLQSGGLWVHAPIAPTDECIKLLKELDAPVEYIVLPTFAYEHKIFVGPFSRKTLEDEDDSTPWADEIEQKVFSSPEVENMWTKQSLQVSDYPVRTMCAFLSQKTIHILASHDRYRQPPECISKESLLASAKNGLAVKILSKGKEVPNEPVVDNKLGANGSADFVLKSTGANCQLFPDVTKVDSFTYRQDIGFQQVPEKVRDWVDKIGKDWPFRRIVPAHFAVPINASRAASYFPPDDMKTLSSLDQFLVSAGVVKKVSGRKR